MPIIAFAPATENELYLSFGFELHQPGLGVLSEDDRQRYWMRVTRS